MNWLQWLLTRWRTNDDKRVRRAIVAVLEGLEPETVDRYLELGLLHHLALLSDIGARAALAESQSPVVESLTWVVKTHRLRSVILPAVPIASAVDLHSICAADRTQQERFIASLSRRRLQVIAAVFDMPLQLAKLFGPHPQADEQLIMRDVYARMDEIVGKAFSFVDETTVLVAVIPGRSDSEPANRGFSAGFLYASRPFPPQSAAGVPVSQLVLKLLGIASGSV